jgi:hypothetical protein
MSAVIGTIWEISLLNLCLKRDANVVGVFTAAMFISFKNSGFDYVSLERA